MLRPTYVGLGRLEHGGKQAQLPFALAAQQRKVKAGHIDVPHRVPGCCGTSGIRLRVAQVLCQGIGMPGINPMRWGACRSPGGVRTPYTISIATKWLQGRYTASEGGIAPTFWLTRLRNKLMIPPSGATDIS